MTTNKWPDHGYSYDALAAPPERQPVKPAAEPATWVEDGSPGNTGHYRGRVQPIDLIESLTMEQLIGAHEAAVIKYVARWRAKGGTEDLRKAMWWLGRLIDIADDLT